MMSIIKKIKIDSSLYFLLLIGMLCGYIKDVFIVFSIVLMHEFGHVIFFRIFNIDIDRIVIYITGGICYVNKKINTRILYDFFINIAGILMQVILFLVVFYLWVKGYVVSTTYNMFKTYNFSIMLFNLLPIIPLDGSKIVLNIYSNFFSFMVAYRMMIFTSVIFFFLFLVFNVVMGVNGVMICGFMLVQTIAVIKEYKYVINKFYLERIIYDNYYGSIVNDVDIREMKIGKYYYFYKNGRYYNEKDFLNGYCKKNIRYNNFIK